MAAKIHIPKVLWNLTWNGLKERSSGEVEALCIWAGKRDGNGSRVQEVMFLDSINGVEAYPLFHRISREATAEIFKYLSSKKLQIIADVHTHPDEWVGLSKIDREHPLEYRVGFTSLVLPHFGDVEPSISGLGMHRYLGNLKWHELTIEEKKQFLNLEDSDGYFKDR